MPELPDVELFRRRLDETSLQRPIERAVVSDARILGDLSPADLAARLEGNQLEASRRHGKHLLVRLARDGWLTLHFGMTGTLEPFDAGTDEPPFTRVRVDFAGDGHLAYTSRRRLGRVGLAADADAFIRSEGLGPDALDPAFDLAAFERLLGARRRDVKSILMDQELIAGIGNIYSDEILFQARLHPKRAAQALDPAERARLFAALKDVLRTAIDCGAGAEQFLERLPAGCLLPERTKDGRCPRCGAPIATLKSGGRTSYFCPHCQPPA